MILFQRLNSPPSRHTHLHAFHELVYVISGDYVVEVDGDRLRLDPGMSIVYPAACPHTPTTGLDLVIMLVQWNDTFLPLNLTLAVGAIVRGQCAKLYNGLKCGPVGPLFRLRTSVH